MIIIMTWLLMIEMRVSGKPKQTNQYSIMYLGNKYRNDKNLKTYNIWRDVIWGMWICDTIIVNCTYILWELMWCLYVCAYLCVREHDCIMILLLLQCILYTYIIYSAVSFTQITGRPSTVVCYCCYPGCGFWPETRVTTTDLYNISYISIYYVVAGTCIVRPGKVSLRS